MPTAKRHTRRIKQMACYLNAVLSSAMSEGDLDRFSEDERLSLLALCATMRHFEHVEGIIRECDREREAWNRWQ